MPKERLERGDDVELSCDEREGLGYGEDEGEYQEELGLFTGHLCWGRWR